MPEQNDKRSEKVTPAPEPPGDILVVDDSPSNLVAIEAAIGDLARLMTACSGPEAIRRLVEQDFALILLDVQMPSMNGFETARIIRERKRSGHTPIIFITAFGGDQDKIKRAYELGAVDFLFKPIAPEVLRAKARVFVDLQRRTAEVARQAAQLREHERREHEQELADERRRWEEEALQRQMNEQRRTAEEMARRAQELARMVAERERAERELTRINKELAEVNRRKDAFLAVLAHELRNPMAPIMTSFEILRLHLPGEALSQPVLRRACEAVQRQVRHLGRLIDDLLDVSRINSGKIELRTGRVKLADLIEHAAATSAPLVEQHGHDLVVELPKEPVVLIVDAVRLTQVVANLLNNAARYTDPGGKIRLSCKVVGEAVEIYVEDNGRGMPPELLERVFDMFFQQQDGGGGLGLGLTLVRRLVEMHGGTVHAASDGVGKGSRFTVRMPLPNITEADGEDTATRGSLIPGDRPLRVVVVDDNADIRMTLRDLLETLGHRVIAVAADGLAGLEAVLSQKPDAALVDIDMPRLDGYSVAERLRAELGPEAIRLVAMTGFGQHRDRERALRAGFDAHLIKPVSAELLLHALYGHSSITSQHAPS